MLTCNLCLEMPFLPSRHSDSDTLDAWGQSSKSDRSTGTIPPRRLPPPPQYLLPIPGQFRIVSSHPRTDSRSIRAQLVIWLAVDGSDLSAPFPAVLARFRPTRSRLNLSVGFLAAEIGCREGKNEEEEEEEKKSVD